MAEGKDAAQDSGKSSMSGTAGTGETSWRERRRQAEERVRSIAAGVPQDLSLEDARRLIDEFCAQQVELEMQNEELRRTHSAFEELSAWYARLYERAPIAYLTVNDEEEILAVNRRAPALLNTSRSALAARRLGDFILPEDRQTFSFHLARVFERKKPEGVDLRVIRQDQAPLWVRLTMTLVGIAGANICGIMINDISARKDKEKDSRLFRALLDQANDAIEVIDPDTAQFLDLNEKCCANLGYSREELLSFTVEDINPRATLEVVKQNMARLRDNPTSTLTLESVHRRKDGSTFPVELNVRLVTLGREYALAIVRDITERKLADEGRRVLVKELIESQTNLRALVAETSKAEERERRRLAAELHDGLAQTLTLIRLCLGRAGNAASADEVRNLVAEARGLVDVSIDHTRSVMAQLSPQILYDLGLAAALRWLGEQMRRYALSVEVTGAPEDFELEQNVAVLAFQCARELLWNVVKHAETHRAKIFYELLDGELTIEVADEGKGFDREQLEAHGAAADRFGLFSIGQRLEIYGGRIEVSSAPGRGTRVTFSVPVAPVRNASPQREPDNAESDAAMAANHELRVVLVDDHPLFREGLRKVLAVHDDVNVVGEAQDGLDAIETARRIKPDVIVMDINMPRMNGIQATKRIIEELPQTVVVGLSVATDAYIESGMKKAGASGCITKARAGEDIYTAIKSAVDARRQDAAG